MLTKKPLEDFWAVGGYFLPGYYQLYRVLEPRRKWCIRGRRSRWLHFRSRSLFVYNQSNAPTAGNDDDTRSMPIPFIYSIYSKDCHQERHVLKIKCHNNISNNFGFLNIQFLHYKLEEDTLELHKEHSLDVICLVESRDDIILAMGWHDYGMSLFIDYRQLYTMHVFSYLN